MAYQKIKIKKSGSGDLTGVLLAILITMGIFTGMYIWLQINAFDADVAIDSKYNDSYNKLIDARDDLDKAIINFQNNATNVAEADSVVQVAINGFKGFGSVLKLPIVFISSAKVTYEAAWEGLDIIPTWVKILAFAGIGGVIVFLLWAIWSGGNPKI